jgi:hypothetical protein
VNDCAAQPYVIPNTYTSINFVPFSTSGTLVGGSQPQGNNFINSNKLLATDASGGLYNLFEGVTTPGNHGDLLAFMSAADIALYDQAGNFLSAFTPDGLAAPDPGTGSGESLGTAAGTVYIFNLFSETVAVSSNGGSIGSIPAWSDGSGPVPIYTPSVILAKRVLNQGDGPGKIANGTNSLQVNSIDAPGIFSVPVDGNQFPLNQNLLLFISRDHWRLTSQFGVVAAEGPITPVSRDQLSDPIANQKEDDMSDDSNTAAGNVYVFNVTSQDLNLSTNGAPITGGTIAAWTMSGADKYQPNVVPVPRKLNASDGPGNFFNGTNSLNLNWIDGLYIALVKIDGAMLPLNQDLLLFVERNQWQLVNQYAVQVASGDVTQAQLLSDTLDQASAKG